jgi:hypothetical protein
MKRDEEVTYVVRGVVHTGDGSPATSLKAKAFDRNIGEADTLLGETATDLQGNYSITYGPQLQSLSPKFSGPFGVRPVSNCTSQGGR